MKRNTNGSAEVQSVELSTKRLPLRIVLFVLSAVLGTALITYGLVSCLSEEPGWRSIQLNATDGVTCGSEFIFQYNLGQSGVSATTEYKALTVLYTQLSVEATRIFSAETAYPGVGNLHTLNSKVNQPVKLEPSLYDALALLEKYQSRLLFLSPIDREYATLFGCTGDHEAVLYDPYREGEVREYLSALAGFVSDPDHVSVRLLGDGEAMLCVSEEYLAFAKQNEITVFADLGYYKNAFAADYFADNLIAKGYRLGTLTSADGFIRNLGNADEEFSCSVFDRMNGRAVPVATFAYRGETAIAILRAFPQNTLDETRYYVYADGSVCHAYVDVSDGLYRNAFDCLTAYRSGGSCAELLLQALPLYIAEQADVPSLCKLDGEGTHFIWCEGRTVHHTDRDAAFTGIYADGDCVYTIVAEE